jgi:4-hydroxy-tetrahydrodipicolinate synthase
MSAAARSGLPLDRMMVGTGAAAVEDAVRLAAHAASAGYAGALVLPPFYYKGVADNGIFAYIAAIVEATSDVPIPIYLYNFPALSGVAYTVDLVTELVRRHEGRIAGLKDSSGDVEYARGIAAISASLKVFPSNEAMLPLARSGPFAGCISATANLNAAYCANAFCSGDARALEKAVSIRKLFDGLPLIPSIKALLALVRNDRNFANLAPPLSPPTDAQLATLLDRYESVREVSPIRAGSDKVIVQ